MIFVSMMNWLQVSLSTLGKVVAPPNSTMSRARLVEAYEVHNS